MPIQNENTVVQVPFGSTYLCVCFTYNRHPYNFFIYFFKEGCKNYLKISLFGGRRQSLRPGFAVFMSNSNFA